MRQIMNQHWSATVVAILALCLAEAVRADEKTPEPSLAFLLSRMRHPEFPEPMGIFRAVERSTYDESVTKQVEAARAKLGEGDVEKLLNSGDTWYVN